MGTILTLLVYDQYEDHFGEKKNTYLIMLIFSDETFSHSPGCLLAEIKGTNTTGEFIQYMYCMDTRKVRNHSLWYQLCPQMLMAIVPELTGILPTLAGSEGRRSLYLLCY
jgi:hypothetical protein